MLDTPLIIDIIMLSEFRRYFMVSGGDGLIDGGSSAGIEGDHGF